MGLIDGATRDECLALEDQLQSYAANEQWIQAWNINGQGLVPTNLSFVTYTAYWVSYISWFKCSYSMPGQYGNWSIIPAASRTIEEQLSQQICSSDTGPCISNKR